ncbi:hypothetical protein BJV82DRAFT_663865 [Fennellomyces sp. T-0311]|nr:hypothetical protein BJV82DRAFT_663865 [Fennellomyces sp. T-0311]
MAKTDGPVFPVYNLDPEPIMHAFSKVGTSIDERDYKQAVEFASLALSKIQELLLVVVLEHRAVALAGQGKFDEAAKDAQEMITYKPTLARGYLRLGEIYCMQGKQLRAIDAYDVGLQSVSEDDPDYAHMVDGKALAMKRNETRVDFIDGLPIEIVDDIITLLSNNSMPACLTVSSAWRKRIFKCSKAWKALTSGDSREADPITSVIPYIASHVEDLTINTSDRHVFLRYLLGMSTGDFTKIKSLYLKANVTKYINSAEMMPVTNAFWQMRDTLTKLVLHLNQNSTAIGLIYLLTACSSLKTLEYSTPSALSLVMGHLIPRKPHNSLLDMELEAGSITDQDLQKLLPYCEQIRRLLLRGCNTTVLDIVDKICPNLRTFGYNAQSSTVPKMDCSDTKDSSPGLYRFYTKNGGNPESASAVLPLIRRNMTSLKVLYVNSAATDSPANLATTYADLELKYLENLTFWDDSNGIIQSLILRSISTCTALEYVEAVELRNIPNLVNTLVDLPPLTSLGLSHISTLTGETDLVRLFEFYAKYTKSGQQLNTVILRNCKFIVTDNVLASLADIKTLTHATFEELPQVSVYGVNEFFKKLSDNISVIKLNEMDAITNDTLIIIAGNWSRGVD